MTIKRMCFVLFQNSANLRYEARNRANLPEVLLQFSASCFLDFLADYLVLTALRSLLRAKCYSFFLHLILFIFLMDVYFPMSNDASNRFGNFIKYLTRSTSEVPRWRGCFRFIVLSINTLYHREFPVKSTFTSQAFFSRLLLSLN